MNKSKFKHCLQLFFQDLDRVAQERTVGINVVKSKGHALGVAETVYVANRVGTILQMDVMELSAV